MSQSIISKEKYILDNRLKIGESIKKLRELRGLSQDELASLIQVKSATISKIENGKFNFSIDNLSRFSDILNFEFELIAKNNDETI